MRAPKNLLDFGLSLQHFLSYHFTPKKLVKNGKKINPKNSNTATVTAVRMRLESKSILCNKSESCGDFFVVWRKESCEKIRQEKKAKVKKFTKKITSANQSFLAIKILIKKNFSITPSAGATPSRLAIPNTSKMEVILNS